MEKGRREIEEKLSKMGDYVRIDYLRRALTSGLDFDTKKFVQLKLSEIYENKGMYSEAAKLMKSAAEINATFKDKIREYMKSVELYIRGGLFNEADSVFAQSISLGNQREKGEMRELMKKYYFDFAKKQVAMDKRMNARKAYEKMLTLDLNPSERKTAQDELMRLYEKLGSIREIHALKNSMNNPAPAPKHRDEPDRFNASDFI